MQGLVSSTVLTAEAESFRTALRAALNLGWNRD